MTAAAQSAAIRTADLAHPVALWARFLRRRCRQPPDLVDYFNRDLPPNRRPPAIEYWLLRPGPRGTPGDHPAEPAIVAMRISRPGDHFAFNDAGRTDLIISGGFVEIIGANRSRWRRPGDLIQIGRGQTRRILELDPGQPCLLISAIHPNP